MAPGIVVTGATVLFSLPLTFLVAALDIYVGADGQARYRACAVASLPFYAYFAAGNAVAAVFVPIMAPEWAKRTLFEPLPVVARPLVYAFFGVVAFEIIISHLTYTLFGQHYTFRDRIDALRGPAQESAINKEIEFVDRAQQKTARRLRALLSEEDLNSYIIQHIAPGEVEKLTRQAKAEDANPLILKSTALAGRRLSEAKAIVRDAKRRRGWWPRLKARIVGDQR